MARIRTVKPEFWVDEKLSPLEPIHRLVFLGLISQADDAGRIVDNSRLIDGLLFPETTDTCKDSLEILTRLSRILRYKSTSGQSLIQIVNWGKHQRVAHPSVFCLPAPTDQDLKKQQLAGEFFDLQENLARPSGDPRDPILDLGPRSLDLGAREKEYGSSENGYPPEFEEVWEIYPKREGSNPKKAAFKAWAARVREEVPHSDLLDAATQYRQFCDTKATTGSPYVMQGATFFGPNERWNQDFTVDELGEANRELLRKRGNLEGVDLENDFQ